MSATIRKKSTLLSVLMASVFGLALSIQSHAEEYISAYGGKGLNHNFMELPGVVLKGDVDFEPSWMAAVSYKHDCATLEWIESLGVTAYCESILVKHWGLQHQWEADLAYQLVSPRWAVSAVDLQIAAAMGGSYAFGTPEYEDGSVSNPEKRYRFLNFNAYDFIVKPRNHEWYAFMRIHHRSGIYGLVAPRNVGSNFFSLGLSFPLSN